MIKTTPIAPLKVDERYRKSFYDKVFIRPLGCWQWLASLTPGGYGRMVVRGVAIYAHRLSWMIHHDQDPGSLYVCHKCDHPWCVNPDHLFLGTHQENCIDSSRKGNRAKGQYTGKAKLNTEIAAEIRASSESAPDLAKKYGVSVNAIFDVRAGRTWWGDGQPRRGKARLALATI